MRVKRTIARLLRLVGVGLALLFTGVAGLLLLLQFDPVSTAAGRRIAAFLSGDSLTVRVEGVTGSWIRGLSFTSLHLSQAPGVGAPGWELEADSLTVSYRLLPLLRKTVFLTRVEVADVRVGVRLPSSADSAAVVGPSAGESDVGPRPWAVEAELIRLRRGRVQVWESDSANPELPWTFSEASATIRELRSTPPFAVTVDTVEGRFYPSGAEGPWGRVLVSGQWRPDRIRLDTLLLESPESHVAGAGTILPKADDPSSDVWDFQLQAAPLHLADLGPLLPATVSDSLRIQVRAEIRYAESAWSAELLADAGSGGRLEARARADGMDSPPDWRSAGASTAELRFQGGDLGSWGFVTAPIRVEANLTGSADSLTGSWAAEWSTRAEGLAADGDATFSPGARPAWSLAGSASYDPGPGYPAGRREATREGLPEGRRIEPQAGGALPGLGGSRFNVAYRVAGVGLSLDSLSAEGEVRVDSARVGNLQVTATDISARVEALSENVVFGSHIRSADSGTVRFSGSWGREGVRNRVRVDSLRFARLNVQSLVRPVDSATALETGLNGTLQGWAVQGADGWSSRGTLRLDHSRVGDQEVSEGRAEIQASSGRADVDLGFLLGSGEVRGQLRWAGAGDISEVTVPGLTFTNFDLGPLLGDTAKPTRVNGTLQGRTRGIQPKEAIARFTVALDSSQVSGVHLASANLEAEADSGRVEARLRAYALGSHLEMNGDLDLQGATPVFAARGTVEHTRLAETEEGGGPRGEVYARFGLTGEGATPDSLRGNLWVEVDSARWDDVLLDAGRLDLRAGSGVVHLDTLALESQAASLVAEGSLPISSSAGDRGEIRLQGRVHQAELLSGLVNAEALAADDATFRIGAAGTLEELSLTAEAHAEALLMDDLTVQTVDLTASGLRRSEEGFTEGAANLVVHGLQRGPLPIRSLEADALLEGGANLAVTGEAVFDDARSGSFAARVEDVRAPRSLTVERFEFLAHEDRWALAEPTRIALEEGIAFDPLLLRAEGQEIRAQGRLARTGPVDLNLGVQDVRLAALSDLLGFPELRGRVSGSMVMEGDAEAPRFTAGLQTRLEARNLPPSDLDVTAEYDDQLLSLQGWMDVGGRRGLQGTATLPFHLTLADSTTGVLDDRALVVSAAADSLPLEWMAPFVPGHLVEGLRGTLDGRVGLTGAREEPALDGALNMMGAEARLPLLGVGFADGNARLRFQGETVFLDSLSARTGDGSLSATGTVGLPGLRSTEYDVRFQATDLQAIRSSGVNATVSGEVEVSGQSYNPSVTGRVVVRRADLYLDEMESNPSVERVVLTEEDYQELARVFGYQERPRGRSSARIIEGLAMNLDLELRRDSWLRQRSNPQMAVQFSGNLSVLKEAGDSIRLVGEVEAISARSYVEQFGRRFTLTRGNLFFQGAPEDTRIDIRAEYEVPSRDNPDQPEVVIALEITGTPENLRLDLSSSPVLEASDMVSYLAVGRPADRTLGGGEGSLAQTGEALALGRISGAVEAYAREEIGLDVVEIITDGTEGVILLAGRYISPELFLGVRQPVSFHRTSGEASDRMSDPELEVELQAVRWLLLNLQAGGRTGVELFVRSRVSYE
jgi:translocation and assembly module TamB